jgi:PBP1b-binding outer membrane lipoprotein LpoB
MTPEGGFMKTIFFIITAALLIAGCDDVKKAGDETAREITGSNLIKQGRQTQQQLHDIDQQQQERFKQLDQQ